jgi:hypothetical protein
MNPERAESGPSHPARAGGEVVIPRDALQGSLPDRRRSPSTGGGLTARSPHRPGVSKAPHPPHRGQEPPHPVPGILVRSVWLYEALSVCPTAQGRPSRVRPRGATRLPQAMDSADCPIPPTVQSAEPDVARRPSSPSRGHSLASTANPRTLRATAGVVAEVHHLKGVPREPRVRAPVDCRSSPARRRLRLSIPPWVLVCGGWFCADMKERERSVGRSPRSSGYAPRTLRRAGR